MATLEVRRQNMLQVWMDKEVGIAGVEQPNDAESARSEIAERKSAE